MRMQLTVSVFALAAGGLLACAAASAQTTPMQTTPRTHPTTTSQPAPNPSNINGSTTFHASNGTIVTVKSWQPSHKSVPPAPAFASLDTNGNGSISTGEAAAYPPLANDFQYADSSHDKAVSESEYTHWVKQP